MDAASFDALFDSFTHQVFRLEAHQVYAVSAEDARLRAFREDTARPVRSVRTDPWLQRIALTTAQGKSWSRVHLIRHPLSEYIRYELVSYVESQAVGESIGLVDLDEHPEFEHAEDFWLFDEGTEQAHAVLMHYSKSGKVLDREPISAPTAVEELAQLKRQVQAAAVPLNHYLARRRHV